VIEDPSTEGALLTDYPKKLLREGKYAKMPMIIGVTDLEGIPSLLRHGKLAKLVEQCFEPCFWCHLAAAACDSPTTWIR